MKKIIIFLTVLTLFVSGNTVFAQTNNELKDIQTLKDKLATKVAELEKKSQRAIAGTVTEVGKNQLRVKTAQEADYLVRIDSELSKLFIISNGGKKDAQLSDFNKGDYVIAAGPIDGQVVNANYIYGDQQYIVDSGKITEVNTSEFYLKVLTIEKLTVTIDIETSTKRLLLDAKSLESAPTTLAKIKVGDTVFFTAKKTGKEKEKNRYSAEKVVIIPQEYFTK